MGYQHFLRQRCARSEIMALCLLLVSLPIDSERAGKGIGKKEGESGKGRLERRGKVLQSPPIPLPPPPPL